MKKSNILALIIIVIFIGLLTVSIMSIEEVPIIKVNAEVTVTDDSATVKIVSVEQEAVNPLKSPRGSSTAGFPSVEAMAIINNAKVSYWAAEDYHGDGAYEFVIGFRKGATPNRGDMVKVIVKVVDEGGRALSSDIRIKIWE